MKHLIEAVFSENYSEKKNNDVKKCQNANKKGFKTRSDTKILLSPFISNIEKKSLYQLIKYFLIYLNEKMKSMTTLNFMKSKIHLMEKKYIHLIDRYGY